MRAVQKFTDEYLEQCKKMKPEQIVDFLEEFRQIHGQVPQEGSQLISMKVPKPLLRAFKARCQLADMPYQTQIKRLMIEWLG